jgi:myosin heavy subunit
LNADDSGKGIITGNDQKSRSLKMKQDSSKASEDEISGLVQTAIQKLDHIETNAKKEKTRIVQGLAKDLEGKIPIDRIAVEIVHQLRHKVSERLIHDCLDEKYKQKHRVENARKQRKNQSAEDLAAMVPLNNVNVERRKKEVVIDTSGNEIVEPQTSISERNDYNDRGNKVISQQVTHRDLTECEDCEIKESKIKELEDALRKTTQLTPADQITVDKITQLQKELQERTRDLEDKTFQNAKLLDELKQLNEIQSNGDSPVTNAHSDIIDFEFSLPYQVVQPYMAREFQLGKNSVSFSVIVNVSTKKILSANVGSTTDFENKIRSETFSW